MLRQWHANDPVDSGEIAKNDLIQRIQGNRNPFIDHPEWVEKIGDF
jgi:endonuclease I